MTFTQWLEQVASARPMSARVKQRYASVLSLHAANSPRLVAAEAAELAKRCPFSALRLLLSDSVAPDHAPSKETVFALKCGLDDAPPTDRGVVRLLGVGRVSQAIKAEVARGSDIAALIRKQPPLESTDVPIRPSRMARLLRLPSVDCVALRWSYASIHRRVANARQFEQRVLSEARTARGDTARVYKDYALVFEESAQDPWSISEHLGETLEDQLRHEQLPKGERTRVVEILASIRDAMLRTGVVWQGFAPRNMFWRDGHLCLIDFEEVRALTTMTAEAASLFLWHPVFFADSLTQEEHQKVFPADVDRIQCLVSFDSTTAADSFEAEYLKCSRVSLHERARLLDLTQRLEGRHRRSAGSGDGEFLFGHQLGHFWGDFVNASVEVAIARYCQDLLERSDEKALAETLEVFEAAMEADVSVLMTTAVTRRPFRPLYTDRLAKRICGCHRYVLSRVRQSIEDWYQQLEQTPGRLMDRVMWHLAPIARGDSIQDLRQWFVGDSTTDADHRMALKRAIDVGCDFIGGRLRAGAFLQYRDPDDLARIIGESLPLKGGKFDDVLDQFATEIAANSISQHDVSYLAFPDSGNALASIAGALLSPLLNQNMIAFDRSAPAATFVEVQVIEWLRELVGYEARPLSGLTGIRDLGGVWTPGGHLSNHIALLIALGEHFPVVRHAGMSRLGVSPAVVMAGPIAHYSHADAAFHLGLGWDSVIRVAATDAFTTDLESVRQALTHPRDNLKPFMVVGVAGNCRTANVDALDELADLCEEFGVWFHVDACHGGSLLFNAIYARELLNGIARADSIALDPHKGLFTPYPSSYLLLKRRGQLCALSRHQERVREAGCWDLGLVTPFLGSRGFESLRTWFMFKCLGVERLGAIVEMRQRAVEYLVSRLEESGLFVIFNRVDIYRVTFLLCPRDIEPSVRSVRGEPATRLAQLLSSVSARLGRALYENGDVCFDEHSLQDLGDRVGLGRDRSYTVIAAAPGNPLLSAADIDRSMAALVQRAAPLADALRASIRAGSELSEATVLAGPAEWDLS